MVTWLSEALPMINKKEKQLRFVPNKGNEYAGDLKNKFNVDILKDSLKLNPRLSYQHKVQNFGTNLNSIWSDFLLLTSYD